MSETHELEDMIDEYEQDKQVSQMILELFELNEIKREVAVSACLLSMAIIYKNSGYDYERFLKSITENIERNKFFWDL